MKYGALWLRAEILLLRQELSSARRDLKAVREICIAQRMRPIDIALVSLRLAKVLLLEGGFDELKVLTRQMFALLGRIERQNRLAAGAYAEFINLTLRGDLTAEFLESLYRRLHRNAQIAPPLLPLREGSS